MSEETPNMPIKEEHYWNKTLHSEIGFFQQCFGKEIPKNKKLAKDLNLHKVEPPTDSKWLTKTNHIWTGWALLDFIVATEALGIAFANHDLTVLEVGHLYNALRHLDVVASSQWPDLDRVIQLRCKQIFGAEIPTTPEAIFTRYQLRAGLLARSDTAYFQHTKRERWAMKPSPFTQILHPFFEKRQSLKRTIFLLEEQAVKDDRSLISTESGSAAPSQRKVTAREQLSPMELLQKLKTYAPEALKLALIDYFTLRRECESLLKLLKRAFEQRNLLPPGIVRPSSTFIILDILRQAADAAERRDEKAQNRHSSEEETGTDSLKFAGKLVEITSMKQLKNQRSDAERAFWLSSG